MKHPVKYLAAFALVMPLTFSCGQSTPDLSQTKVTDVQHSIVKRQSIGNCWLYAVASWAESLHLERTGEIINYSESYWTYWHWYDQLVGSSGTEIRTGGTYGTASRIIRAHGAVLEGEFIANEANSEMSYAQSSALSRVNYEMREGGRLATRADRTPENVRAVLDEAYGVNMAEAEARAIPAAQLVGGKDRQGNRITLLAALSGNANQRWNQVSYPRIYGENATPSLATQNSRKQLLRRVLKAMNDYKPVIITLMVDFNAMSTEDGTFSLETLAEAGAPGTQGGHMLVLEDYVVDEVPGIGTIDEGDVSPELKERALQGKVRHLVTKNSWGTNRPERGLTDGYTRFTTGYLDAQLGWKNGDEPDATVTHYTSLTDFVLPPGY